MFTSIMPTENKSNKIITIVLAVIITLAAITVIYISLPQNKENEKTSGENNGQQNGNNPTEESVILTVIYGDEQTNYTLEDLEALDSYTGMGGKISSKTPPSLKEHGTYEGVNVTTLVELIAGDISNYSITVYSSIPDNQTYTFSTIQGNIDVYNSTNLSTPMGQGSVTMIISYMKDGDYLNESQDGKLKIAFVNIKEELLTKASLWWSHVVSIEIVKQ